ESEAIVRRYDASFVEAETVGSVLLSYTLLAKHFDLEEVLVCDTNLRDGVLHEMAGGSPWTEDFQKQIIRSSISLARRFGADEDHAQNVAELARELFHQLAPVHQLGTKFEVFLYAAAMLFEIGLSINTRSNHKHAFYLIRNSDIFGLSEREALLVALVVRYHRRATPQASHEAFAGLPQSDRVAVSKMAALLRMAIALDDTRSGRIRRLRCSTTQSSCEIEALGVDDVSLEQVAMRSAALLFRDVFGMQVALRGGGAVDG
ncbi:MAG: exopolyphosphatase, partial [Planctomycetota bacterium]